MVDRNPEIEEALLRSRMKGEKLISNVRLFLILVLLALASFIFIKSAGDKGLGKAILEKSFLVEFLSLAVATVYSFWVLGRIKRNRYLNAIKYISPFIEMSLLTVIMYYNADSPRNALIMTGSPTFLYLVFLILCSFRNSPSSVIFAGVYATICYAVLSLTAMNALKVFEQGGNVFTNGFSRIVQLDWDDELIKPLIFMVATGLLASLSRRFNRTVTDQIRASAEREGLKGVLVENVRQVSESLVASGKSLVTTYGDFAKRVEGLVESSRRIGEETAEEYGVIETTTTTIVDMIGSVGRVSGSIKEQAFLVGETAAAIAEMEGSIRTITETSQRASVVAQTLFAAAKEGEAAAAEACNAILDTERCSRQIEEIVELITGIAGRTDLLSMNAAIEAAHAGETGKGFAVVAEEIRRLSETSGSNAKQIGTILKEIIGRIQNSTALSQKASLKLQSILNDADMTKGINSTIQNAMEEEVRTVNAIVKSLTSLETITATVKESSQRQSEAGAGLTDAVAKLRKEADSVSGLVDGQQNECGGILKLTAAFDSVVKDNDATIERLEAMIRKV